MMDGNFSNRRGRRVMICVRGECAPREAGFDLEVKLLKLIEAHGLDDPDHPHRLRCTVTNCLAVCKDGPVMMVHPEGIRYTHVTEENLELIFQQHFLEDQLVAALIYSDQPTRSVLGRGDGVRRSNRRRRRG